MTDIKKERENRSLLATQKQRKASNPDKSVWVEASAGTGKTKVLSDRVLRLLLKGVPPAKILCLTYTKAAAVEMSTRIAGRLSRWAVAKEEKLQEEISEIDKTNQDSIYNAEEDVRAARNMHLIVSIFIYGFIAVISIIGITNIYYIVLKYLPLSISFPDFPAKLLQRSEVYALCARKKMQQRLRDAPHPARFCGFQIHRQERIVDA